MSDYTPPSFVGMTEIPQKAQPPEPKKGKRGPGVFFLHGGQAASYARAHLNQLEPGKAAEFEFDDPRRLFLFQVLIQNVDRKIKVSTKRHGLRLRVWLREPDAQLKLEM